MDLLAGRHDLASYFLECRAGIVTDLLLIRYTALDLIDQVLQRYETRKKRTQAVSLAVLDRSAAVASGLVGDIQLDLRKICHRLQFLRHLKPGRRRGAIRELIDDLIVFQLFQIVVHSSILLRIFPLVNWV